MNEYRNIIGPVGAALCFWVAHRLWLAYKSEVLLQRVYRMMRPHQ